MSTTKVTDSMRDVTVVDGTKITGAIPLAALSNAPATDLSVLEYNQALLAFKIASANQLAKFQMVDQVIDEYQDATGIDASASTNELAGGATTTKYFEGATTTTPTVTGGATTVVGDYTYHVFTSGSVDYVTDTTQDLDILVVAGGGAAGQTHGGGGGAGGLIYQSGRSVANGTYAAVVGAGATGGGVAGTSVDSTFGSIFTAKGGGNGATDNSRNGSTGGSGGGGSYDNTPYTGYAATQPSESGDSGTYGFGFAGGEAVNGGGNASGAGGGGGSGAVAPALGSATGANSSTGGGDGGVGKELTIFNRWGTTSANVATSGTDGGWFAGGGGGGVYTCPNDAAGGIGGGGDGNCTSTTGGSGLANTGGGGGGTGDTSANGAGGSGIIIVRRSTDANVSGANLTLQSVATTAESAPTTADLVVLIEDGAGTATVNTDIKGFVSRNGSAFSSEVTLVDEGDWGTSKRILVARNIDISGITSGVAMKYKLTTHNQSASSKETRIHATSLAWA